MKPTQELIDDLFRRKVRQARAMPPAEKVLSGAELFDMACRVTMDGIRGQHPGIDEQEVREILRRRLQWAKRRETGD